MKCFSILEDNLDLSTDEFFLLFKVPFFNRRNLKRVSVRKRQRLGLNEKLTMSYVD